MYDVPATSKNSSEIARAPVNTRLSGNLLAPFRYQVVHCGRPKICLEVIIFAGNGVFLTKWLSMRRRPPSTKIFVPLSTQASIGILCEPIQAWLDASRVLGRSPALPSVGR